MDITLYTSRIRDLPLGAVVKHLDFPRLYLEIVAHACPTTRVRVLGSDIEVAVYDQSECEVAEMPGGDDDVSNATSSNLTADLSQ